MVAAPIYIPTDSEQGFPFFHIPANTCYLVYFPDSCSNRGEATSVFFICISLMTDVGIFSCTIGRLCLLWKDVYSASSTHVLIRLVSVLVWVLVLVIELYDLYIFWILTPYQIYGLQIFSPLIQATSSVCGFSVYVRKGPPWTWALGVAWEPESPKAMGTGHCSDMPGAWVCWNTSTPHPRAARCPTSWAVLSRARK